MVRPFGSPHSPPDEGDWVGIDVGTQAVRVAIVAGSGHVRSLASVPLQSSRFARDVDGDRHEQDPDEWWQATVRALAQAVAGAGPCAIHGIATCGTSGTVLLIERTPTDPARPVTPGLMYNDLRATEQAARLRRLPPAESWRRTGFVPTATSGLAKAMWLVEHHDVGGGRRLAHQVDLINARLTGGPTATDTSHAMKTGVDLFTGGWPAAEFGALGLPVEALPEVVAPGTLLGTLGADVAALTGLPAGTPVYAGMSDGCAGQIASGVLADGAWSAVLGTTTVLKGVVSTLIHDPLGSLYHHRPPGPGWWAGGASAAGAGLLSELFSPGELLELHATADLRTPAGVVTYPLRGRGERFPFVEPSATTFSTGTATDRTQLYASVMQGVALMLRLSLERVAALGAPLRGELSLVGGATKNARLVQLIANVLGRPVHIPGTPEGAVGMAVLAASTRGDLTSAARRMIPSGVTVAPVPAERPRFEESFQSLVDGLRRRGWMDHRPLVETT
jgi:xylulokinase